MKNYSKARKAGIFLLAYTLLFVGLASWLSYVFAQSGKTLFGMLMEHFSMWLY